MLSVFLLAVIMVAVYGVYRAYAYTQNDPNFCRVCHTMETAWDRWNTSEHRKITCHSCHEQPVLESLEQVLKFAIQRPNEVSKHAEVPAGVCAKCHESGDPRWRQVAATAGHSVHADAQAIQCVVCHGTALHRFVPPKEICRQCHTDQVVKISEMGGMHCTSCHNYLATEPRLEPRRSDCLECHLKHIRNGVTWPEVAPMHWECSQCHKPHEQVRPVVKCTSCHQGVPSEGKHAVTSHATLECQTCHKPHQWEVTGREACLQCHSDKEKHNEQGACATCHNFKE